MARSEAIADKLKQSRDEFFPPWPSPSEPREGSHEALGAPQPANYPAPRGDFQGSVHTALVLLLVDHPSWKGGDCLTKRT